MVPATERWFHSSLNGHTAERLMIEKGVNGSFLIRESQSNKGDFVLTARVKVEPSKDDQVSHFKIRHHNNKYYFEENDTASSLQKNTRQYEVRKFNSLTQFVEYYRRNTLVENSGIVVNMKYPLNATSTTAQDIDDRIRELSKHDGVIEEPKPDEKEAEAPEKCGFWEEFDYIQHQECKNIWDKKVGQEESNISKNRYRNILPYDHTRVKLKKPASSLVSSSLIRGQTAQGTDQSTDYINASRVELVDHNSKSGPNSKKYIATQGPLPNTIDDFWLMVWQEKSDCIVMVTKEMERGKNKCSRYWPTFERPTCQYGPIEVTILDEISRKVHEDEYTRRVFEIRYLSDENNDCRTVRRLVQYQYYAWPDQHTPSNPEGIVRFLEDINRHLSTQPRGPLIVHCSAGIGRSGAVIVIDMLMDQLEHHGLECRIDIQNMVRVVRRQRPGLVQTVAQYKFIYLAIQRYIALMKRRPIE